MIHQGGNFSGNQQSDIFREQPQIFSLSIVRNDAKVLPKSSLVENFKNNQGSKILIVSGAVNQDAKSKFIRENLDSNEIVEYCCSEYTNSTHLQDLMSESHKFRYLLIKNVQTTLAEDRQWNTSTFLESLRFAVTYDGYYDVDFNFQPLQHKFLLSLDDLNELDPRILNLSTAIQFTEGELQEIDSIDTTLQEFIISKFHSDCQIFTLYIENSSRFYDKELISSQVGKVRFFEFCNSRLVNDSLDTLSQLLAKGNLIQKIQDKKLFILRENELRLFDEKHKSILFHLLNKLKKSPFKLRVNFLYIINNLGAGYSNYFDFFSSIGITYKLIGYKPASISEFLLDKFKEHTTSGNGLKLDSSQQNWFVERISTFLLQSNVSNLEAIDNFMKLFIFLVEKSQSDLSSERKTLVNGLNNLNLYERVVDNVKSSCKAEESLLKEKKKEIDKLMELLDTELKEAHQKREHIEGLKNKQMIKTREIDENRQRIKQKLSKVEPLIESSKIEVAKYLKPEALNEIKSLRSPPKTIKDILDVLFVLLGIKDSSWVSIKAHLTRCSIKDELTNYDFQKNLNESLLKEIEFIMKTKRDSFNKLQAERASKAIVPILGWIEAAIEYGKVLTSLIPLNEQLNNLREESELFNKESQKIKSETIEVDRRIQDYSDELERLKHELGESQKKANIVKEQLMNAQKVCIEMEDRINKWRLKSESLEILLKSEQLAKLCLIASLIAIRFNNSNLLELLTFFGLKSFTQEKFLITILNLFEEEREFNEYSIKPDQTNRILQILLVKLCLTNNSDAINIPFIDVGSQHGSQTTSIEKVVQFLCFDKILTDPKNITILNQSQEESNDWLQSIELSCKLNKLVLIELQNKPAFFHLDIIDLILSRSLLQGKSKLKCILIGNLEDELCDAFKHMLRPIKLSDFGTIKGENDQSIKSTILKHLVEFRDPELGKTVEKLEHELMSKQISARSMEKDLLKQLASVQIGSNNELSNDLAKILSELYQVSSSLENYSNEMGSKLEELRLKQNQHLEQVDKAANFYRRFVVDLNEIDNFYHMSLDSYVELLLEGEGSLDVDIYKRIINRVMLSMRCEDKLLFGSKLKNYYQKQQQVAAFDVNGTKIGGFSDHSLKDVLLELLIENKEDHDRSRKAARTNFKYKLAIVMHDPTKSSPQVEIDELFRQPELVVGGRKITCRYTKLYATGESSPEHIEFELRKLSTSHDLSSVEEALDDGSNYGYETNVKCLCIANAQLSSDWLNSNLLKLLRTHVKDPSTSTNGSNANSKTEVSALVILVAEKEAKAKVFIKEILDCAKLRYWHDELALNLPDRYEQFSRAMLSGSRSNGCTSFLKTNSTSGAKVGFLVSLAKQLILFHVVCQELTRSCHQSGAMAMPDDLIDRRSFKCWERRQSYNFDYDLLCLAFKTLKILWEQSQKCYNNSSRNFDNNQFRQTFCDYLKNIIYGSRMESIADEQRLSSLIERFISSPESGSDQLNKLDQLKSASTGSAVKFDRLLADLID